MSQPRNKFVYYCSRKRCGAVIIALDKPAIVYAKLKCDACGHLTTYRPSVEREDSRLSTAQAGV